MKIIKEGKLPQERVFKEMCGNCSAIVEFTQGEAQLSSHRNETHYSVTYPTPGCFHAISVEG